MVDQRILSAVLGRDHSLFEEALRARAEQLKTAIEDSRILVIGAGGSVGSAFVQVLSAYNPAALHLVDLSENSLVSLVRELRADGASLPSEFTTYAIGFDEPEFEAFLEAQPQFDYILNFAALKHVRSERDPYTAMRLLRVNVLANHHLLERLAARPPRKYFCVSSDKAVNPASLMGASKSFMERVGLAHAARVPFGSARFANVAFSQGSLLQSFCQRLDNRQPLAGPNDVRRYFISHAEAGELCLLSCFLGENGEIFTPEMNPERDLKGFPEIAAILLRQRGLTPVFCNSEADAIARSQARNGNHEGWPCFFAPSNTPGEKPFEEFHAAGERVVQGRLPGVSIVEQPRSTPFGSLESALARLQSLRRLGAWSLEDLLSLVQAVVPEFHHVGGRVVLDQKL